MVFVPNLLSASFAVLAAAAWINSLMVKGYPTDTQQPRPPGSSYPTPQLGFGRDRKGRQYEFFAPPKCIVWMTLRKTASPQVQGALTAQRKRDVSGCSSRIFRAKPLTSFFWRPRRSAETGPQRVFLGGGGVRRRLFLSVCLLSASLRLNDRGFLCFLAALVEGIKNCPKPDNNHKRDSRQKKFQSALHESFPVDRGRRSTDGDGDNRNYPNTSRRGRPRRLPRGLLSAPLSEGYAQSMTEPCDSSLEAQRRRQKSGRAPGRRAYAGDARAPSQAPLSPECLGPIRRVDKYSVKIAAACKSAAAAATKGRMGVPLALQSNGRSSSTCDHIAPLRL